MSLTDLLRDQALSAHLANTDQHARLEQLLRQETLLLDFLSFLDPCLGPNTKRKDLRAYLQQARESTHAFLDISPDTDIPLPKIKRWHPLDLSNPLVREVHKSYLLGGGGFSLVLNAAPYMLTGILPLGLTFLGALTSTHFLTKGLIQHAHHRKGTYYHPLHQTINVDTKPRAQARIDISHEYTHHLAHELCDLDYHEHGGVLEGLCRAMERRCSQDWFDKEDSPALLLAAHPRSYGEFRSTYLWLCDVLGKKPYAEFLHYPSPVDDIEYASLVIHGRPSHYALGNTFLALRDLEQGNAVYQHLIHNRFRELLGPRL